MKTTKPSKVKKVSKVRSSTLFGSRNIARGLAVLVIAGVAAMGVGIFGTSHAASDPGGGGSSQCYGYTLVEKKGIFNGSYQVATLNLFTLDGSYSHWCAIETHFGSYWGRQYFTNMFVYTCQRNLPGVAHGCDRQGVIINKLDGGNYSYFAGPLKFDSVDHCIHVYGQMNVPDDRYVRDIWIDHGGAKAPCAA